MIGVIGALFACKPREVAMQPVTIDNFVRAETDTYFAGFVREGAFGRLMHSRELADVEHQSVVRMNRDTLYSRGVFDLDAGPVTITLPDAGGRFMSLLLISEDHYNPATFYAPGAHQITREQIGTRYVTMLVRTFVDPNDPEDLKKVHALQDAIQLELAAPGKFEVPRWDNTSLAGVRDELKQGTDFDTRRAFGKREEVDARDHRIGAARGWGGNPAKDAIYVSGQPKANDGVTVHRLVVKDVPVDGFWSITVYDEDGFFQPNAQGAYSLNNVTARRSADGSYTIQFGDCGTGEPNCLPITPGWNYTVRLYRPRQEILDGRWTFPGAEPVR
jgi:hypothetical protein